MENSIRVGILGAAGFRGRELFQLFSQSTGVSITALADCDREKLSTFYDVAFGIRLYTDAIELAKSLIVDAIVIATPDYLHEEHACMALKFGKHVYLEKPMAITPKGCDNLIRVAKESTGILYVGHNLRYFTVIKKIKEVIDSGVIGDVKSIWCRQPIGYGRWAYFSEGRWHKKRENTGGLLIHKGSHDIDIIHWFGGGHSTRVVAMGALSVWHDQPDHPDIEDLSSVLMQLNNGVQATYTQCHFAFRAAREYTILGTKGTLQNIGDDPAIAKVQLFTKRGLRFLDLPTNEWQFEEEKGFHGYADVRTVEEFLGIVRGERQPSISLEDAAWAVKTGWAATQSLCCGNIPIEIL